MKPYTSMEESDLDVDGWGKSSYRSGGGYWGTVSTEDLSVKLAPLIERLREYDDLRQRLEKRGGVVADLNRATELLNRMFVLSSVRGDHECSLTDRAGLRHALIDAGDYDVRLDVRQRPSRMPVYYLCRIRRDYWAEYSLIVEDLYRSPDYPSGDERFARLMSEGHESYFLRLSPFREGVRKLLAGSKDPAEWQVDDALYDLGRYVFQAAWHDDQRPGVLTATHFGLTRFRQAIELLYLCLSGDLCELRSAIGERMLGAFETVYPQPAIGEFLRLLVSLDGSAINEIPQQAVKLYARLLRAFGRFIETEVPWGAHPVPLYKLLFANLYRLDQVAGPLEGNRPLAASATALEAESKQVIEQILARKA